MTEGNAGQFQEPRSASPPKTMTAWTARSVPESSRTEISFASGSTGNPVVIDRVTILSPRIAYEINQEGQSNIELLKKRLQGDPAQGPARKQAAEKEGDSLKKLFGK